jgi:hypothetical protein
MAASKTGGDGDFLAQTKAAIRHWHAIEPPNATGEKLAGELEGVIRAFEKVRDEGTFGDEPADFVAALHELRDTQS